MSGIATRFFRNALRRSSLAWVASAFICFAATTAPIYFTKLMPHFSHFTPVRCLLPHEGHSKRIVMWQRWQKRATSRTAAPHFGQGIVACGTGAAVGSQAFAGLDDLCTAALGRGAAVGAAEFVVEGFRAPVFVAGFAPAGSSFAGSITSDAAPGGLPPAPPEDELLIILHFNGDARRTSAPPHPMHPLGYPVQKYRYVKLDCLLLHRRIVKEVERI